MTLDFHVPPDPRLTVKAQPQRAVRGREVEFPSLSLPVLPCRRSPGLVRVTAFGPRPQPAQELTVSFPEGFLTANRREVAAPASDDRVKRQDQVRLPSRLVVRDDFSEPAMMPVNRLRVGLDEGLETEPGRAYGILADVAPQEVEAPCSSVAVERMDYARFTRLQFQPHAVEFLSDEGLAVLYYLSVRVYDHQSISVADHRRSIPLAGKRPFDALFQTVQRNVGQQGREWPALRGSFLRRKPFPLVHYPSLQPGPDLASERRAGGRLLE